MFTTLGSGQLTGPAIAERLALRSRAGIAYIGTARSNWCTHTGCQPDRSDRNLIQHNDIADTTAEAIDIKEGTSNGTLHANTFSGAAITAADSWVDIKGNSWTITDNTGTDTPQDGFQTHESSTAGANTTPSTSCTNRTTNAELSNIPCQ